MIPGSLERECRVYARYLIGRDPSPYVVSKYLEFHSQCGAKVVPGDAFDRVLCALSARGGLSTRLADIYASRFAREAALRKKLVLTLALLECAPGSFEYLDDVEGGGALRLWLRLATGGARYAALLALSAALLLPVRAWTAMSAEGGKIPAAEN